MKKICPSCGTEVFEVYYNNVIKYRCIKCNLIWDNTDIHYQGQIVDVQDLVESLQLFVDEYLGKNNEFLYDKFRPIINKYNLTVTNDMKVIVRSD